LVGHSYGSVLSVDVAGEQKDKVAGVVLISSTSPAAFRARADEVTGVFKLPLWILESRAMKMLVTAGAPALFWHPGYDKKVFDDNIKMLNCHSMFYNKAFWLQLGWLDEEMLKRVNQPVLLVHGRGDKLTPLSDAQDLVPLFPTKPKMHIIDFAAHMVVAEQPEETAAVIHDFVSAIC